MALIAVLVPARAEFRDGQIIYDIDALGLDAIAKRLGLHFEEHGMGIYELWRGYHFHAYEPHWGCFVGASRAQLRKLATKPRPLILRYKSVKKHLSPAAISDWNSGSWGHISVARSELNGTAASLEATLFLTHGVTFRTVLEHLRRFDREIREFETLRKSK